MSKLDGKTYVTSWLLISIAKELSKYNELLTFEHSSSFDICLNDDLSSHNEEKDGDQNIDFPCDQLHDNVGT